MISVLKFPFQFDAGRLKSELAKFTADEWIPHFNTHNYEGDWSGIALRAAKNAHVHLYPDPTATEFEETDMLRRCAYVPKVLKTFECPLETVRFLRLGPGAIIREHRDHKLGFEDGIARVHIPVKTNADVKFFLNKELIEMREGEAWYLNFNLHHSVQNNSSEDRVHLVIDCIVNDWLREFFSHRSHVQ